MDNRQKTKPDTTGLYSYTNFQKLQNTLIRSWSRLWISVWKEQTTLYFQDPFGEQVYK